MTKRQRDFQVLGTCLALSVLLPACAGRDQLAPQKSNLTYGAVKSHVRKGRTTQAELLALLGSPNIVTKNRAHEEVWTYSRQSYDARTGNLSGTLILIGGSKAFSSTTASSFDFIVTFNSDDVVEDYSVVSSRF